MGKKYKTSLTRRQALSALGVAGLAGVAGCTSGGGGSDNGDGTSSDDFYEDLPPRGEGLEEWGQELNRHARDAGIEWDQFADQDISLKFGMGLHKYSTTTEPLLPYFEELTGISVEYEIFEEDQFWSEARQAMADQSGSYDGFMVGLWPAGEYHEPGWVEDLNQYIEDPTLTDKDWLAMEDFREDTIELMTFPNEDGTESFVGFPNGIEVYGCVGYDKPTFEQLGIAEPTNFAELEDAARQVSESDEVDREGIVSRTSQATLSSANWGTMFKTYGADWIDRQNKEAAFNSEQGIASLERFGGMLNEYGPENPGTKNWYNNNDTYNNGDVAMIYSTPQTSGAIDTPQMERTKWLSPLEGPNGREPVADTWIWSTGISSFSENPEAAWLFIQWANSRAANFMLSTKQWGPSEDGSQAGDEPRAGHARFKWIWDQDMYDYPPIPGEGYEQSFKEGMSYVPTDPYPPVPVDTPQNMNIMSEAAFAMSNTVTEGREIAADQLNAVAPRATEYAKQIPDRYIR